jgi:hypothetical protein
MHFPTLGVAFAMSLCCTSYSGETNDSARVRFCLPPINLRPQARPEVLSVESAAAVKPLSFASVGSSGDEHVLSDWDFHSRVVRSDRFYLVQSKPLPESGLVRFVDGIFTPEVFPVGKASVSSPFLTVIKRKNPLCLLSGLAPGEEPTGDLSLIFKILIVSW